MREDDERHGILFGSRIRQTFVFDLRGGFAHLCSETGYCAFAQEIMKKIIWFPQT